MPFYLASGTVDTPISGRLVKLPDVGVDWSGFGTADGWFVATKEVLPASTKYIRLSDADVRNFCTRHGRAYDAVLKFLGGVMA